MVGMWVDDLRALAVVIKLDASWLQIRRVAENAD